MKYIVIVGYILVMVVMVVGITSIYNNLVEFSEKKVRDENLSELIIVGNTISKLYDIESSQGLFNYEGAKIYFHKYDSVQPLIYANLDTLKSLSREKDREIKLDSIKLLIQQKNENLQKIVVLLDSIEKSPRITRETTSRMVPKKLNTEIADYLEKKKLKPSFAQSKTDTTVIRKEQKGFFARVRDVFAGGEADSTVVIEKQSMWQEKDFKLVVDTLVNMIRYAERVNLDNQRKFQYLLLERQTDMSNTNSLLTMRIDELLKGIEKEELDKSIRLLEDKNVTLQKSQRTMSGVSWLALCIALVFGFLFLFAFNRSQKYRRKLEESNERIQNLLKSREKLMLSISHDIKAPMSSILGYIELMSPNVMDAKKKAYLGNMKNSSEHVLQLVMNLLDYHKLESGAWTHKKMNFNVAELVNNTCESFRPLAAGKKLQYEVNNTVSPDLISYGDPYMIRQVMSNLLSNAIKYTPKGKVAVEIEVLQKNDALTLKFSVKDTGKGIDKKDQEIIFHEFEQLASSAAEAKMEGSGLGLAITKALVQEMQGTIKVYSQKEKGSEFVVIIPLQKSIQTSQMEIATLDNPFNAEGLNVLLVDDDPIQLTMASEMLQRKNIGVVTENNPENVLNILRTQTFDMAFIDVQMPYMNGFTLVKSIRSSQLENIAQLPIIALSAKSDIRKEDVRNGGFTDFLMKPFTSVQLYDAIREHMNRKGFEPISADTTTKGVAALISVVMDDKETSAEILKTFCDETSKNMLEMEQAFRANDKKTAGQLAHKIVPLIEMMGDEELSALLRKIEREDSLSAEERNRTLSSIKNHIMEARQMQEQLKK